LYDPEADNEDQKWMEQKSTHKKAEGSDAVLNCPACLTDTVAKNILLKHFELFQFF